MRRIPKKSKESGQAIVLILLLGMVGVLGTVALVRTGVQTAEKMQLQNAADATAFSVSTLEARALNYSAYTTRAMVANEVAIGQMTSLLSWAYMKRSSPVFMEWIASKIDNGVIPYPAGPVATPSFSAVARPLRSGFEPIRKFVAKFTKPASMGISQFNRVYSLSQDFMHLATMVFSIHAIDDVPERNSKGAKISSFGYAPILLHFFSKYGATVAGMLGADTETVGEFFAIGFLERNSIGDDAHDDDAIKEFVEVVNDSRDPFTEKRQCGINKGGEKKWIQGPSIDLLFFAIDVRILRPNVRCPDNDERGGHELDLLGAQLQAKIPFPFFPIPFGSWNIDFYSYFGLDRTGGTELLPITLKDGNKEEQAFGWGAADIFDSVGELAAGIGFCFDIPLLFTTISYCTPSLPIEFEFPGYPLGVGGAYAAGVADKQKFEFNMGESNLGGAADTQAFDFSLNDYPYNGDFLLPFYWPPPPIFPKVFPTPDQIRDLAIYANSAMEQMTDETHVARIDSAGEFSRNVYKGYKLRPHWSAGEDEEIGFPTPEITVPLTVTLASEKARLEAEDAIKTQEENRRLALANAQSPPPSQSGVVGDTRGKAVDASQSSLEEETKRRTSKECAGMEGNEEEACVTNIKNELKETQERIDNEEAYNANDVVGAGVSGASFAGKTLGEWGQAREEAEERAKKDIEDANTAKERLSKARSLVTSGENPLHLELGEPQIEWSKMVSGWEAPFLLIALTKPDVVFEEGREPVEKGGYDAIHTPAGRFKIEGPSGISGKRVPLGVIGKSRVYYSTPPDSEAEESQNAWNPYWEARLVDTSYIDRVAALLGQHHQPALPEFLYEKLDAATEFMGNIFDAIF